MPPLTASQVAAWRRVGVLTVADALQDAPLLGRALEQAAVELGEFTERALGDGTAPRKFPYAGESEALNSVSLHPRLLAAAAQLLGEGEHGIRLAQATLLDPARSGPSDGAADHAACHLCAPLAQHPEAVVVSLSLSTGSATLTRLGCAVPPIEGLVQRLILRSAPSEWISADSFVRALAGQAFIGGLLPPQRSALGFPEPGNIYWTSLTLEQMVARYPGWDPQLYLDAGAAAVPSARPPAVACQPPSRLTDRDGTPPWATPEGAAGIGDKIFSDAQVEQFRGQGWLLIDGIWPADVMADACAAAAELYPEEGEHEPGERFGAAGGVLSTAEQDGSLWQKAAFPFDAPPLNAVCLEPRLLSGLAQLLDVSAHELRMTQSTCNGKYGERPSESGGEGLLRPNPFSFVPGEPGNQGMHVDFGNNTLTVPARNCEHWAAPDEVQGLLSLSDHSVAGGPTAFVPGLAHTADARLGVDSTPESIRDSVDTLAELYAAERVAAYAPGTVLLYSGSLWHRGTPVLPGKLRRKHHLSFRTAAATWCGGQAEVGEPSATSLAALSALTAETDTPFDAAAFVGGLSVDQRAVLGFPGVGARYWSWPGALEATAERYSQIDLAPYVPSAPRL